ncbi:MAG: methylated-DNA--[protein]-cysteine S-methyltransferase [Casimicrobiaceae bacterium]
MSANPQTCQMPSPLGEILLVANARGDALRGLYLEGQKYFPEDAVLWTASPRLPLFRDAVAQLGEYFAGRRENFAIPLEPSGTAFQRTVWREIARVPYGGTISYATLAKRCGRPSAVRAAGAATGRNPITVVIPCHRIVGSGGALTGYAGGLDRKRALLAIEAGSGRTAR